MSFTDQGPFSELGDVPCQATTVGKGGFGVAWGLEDNFGTSQVALFGRSQQADLVPVDTVPTAKETGSEWARPLPILVDSPTQATIASDTKHSVRPDPVLVDVPTQAAIVIDKPIPEQANPITAPVTGPVAESIVIELDARTLVSRQPDPLGRSGGLEPGQLLPVNPPPVIPAVQFTNLTFSGLEGATGTVQIQLGITQAPPTPLTLTFSTGNFLVVDTDNNLQNGTQTTITFTAENWSQPRTLWFMAEVDGVATDRLTGNELTYTLSGSPTAAGSFNLGTVRNTYAPDLTRFNLDLDFRNDTTGFWTEARRAIAQRAANDWANLIANEWTGLQLNTSFSKIGNDGNYTANTFAVKRYVDDLVVFMNTINTNGTAAGFGAVEYSVGGWLSSPELQTRVGQVAIDPAVGDLFLYNVVLHELGHTLGLVGLNWQGFLQQNLATPQTAVFSGLYSTAANGGNPVPLQSQDGPNPVTGRFDYWHPANRIQSIMSYGWIYSVTGPTAMDAAMLADSGYQVYGVTVPLPAPLLTLTPVELAVA